MKTVLVDNSLCVSELSENAKAEDIYGYIKAIAQTGVRYVELDFRALLKVHRLPEGVGYIFRAVDPMFLQLADIFNFDYVVLTFSDLKKNMKPKIPIMLEVPFVENTHRGVLRYAQSQTEGKITAVRFSDDFGYKSIEEMKRFVSEIKNAVPLPVDFCPRNTRKTALDCAIKFSFSGADSVTMAMPKTNRFASLEEYAVTLLSVFDMLPSGFDINGLFGAVYYYKRIFKNADDADILKLFEMLDWDIRMLKNAETGEKVNFNIGLKNANMLKKTYSSALEKMMRDITDQSVFNVLFDAVKSYETNVCSDRVIYEEHKGLLN